MRYQKILCFVISAALCLAFAGCSRHDPADDIELFWTDDLAQSDKAPEDSDNPDLPVIVPHAAPASFAEQISEFKKKNSDAVGWLYLPDTTINEVLVQTDDNTFYHRRDNMKQESFNGCLYADYDSRIIGPAEKIARNVVIYGHSMDDNPDGANFSQLKKWLKQDFAEKHPYIYFSSATQDYVYEIFSVMYTSDQFFYINSEPTDAEFEAIIKEAKEASQFIYPTSPGKNDKIITLSTCTYLFGGTANESQRFVIMGRMVMDGEDFPESISLSKNPSPKEPVFKS